MGHASRLAVIASGEGSTLQAVLDAIAAGTLRTSLAAVISNNSGSGALRRAQDAGIPVAHLSSQTHRDPDQLDQAVLNTLMTAEADVVLLAGYAKKLGARVLAQYRGRIINTHPALLPKFGGKGMYGHRVHEAVLAAGETETGVSIHLVDADYDTGPVLAQARVPVLAGDTAADLATRVQAREREFLVEVLGLYLAAARLAAALDREDYEALTALLADDCEYLSRKGPVVGPEAIVTSYRGAGTWARSTIHNVTYESAVRIDMDGVAVVTFTDRFVHDRLSHAYACEQLISVDRQGRVDRIVHRELPGQREAADAFLRRVGLSPPA